MENMSVSLFLQIGCKCLLVPFSLIRFIAYQSGLMGQAPQMSAIPTSMMSPIPSIQAHNVPSAYQHSPALPSSGPTVLLVANLDEQVIFGRQRRDWLAFQRITCDILFTLFGVYGNVLRVKILYNKKDNALLQMADNHQATTGRNTVE